MKKGQSIFPYQHIPRAYTDLTVTVLADGSRLDFPVSGKLYNFYIAWLADHLLQSAIPIPPEQAGVARDLADRDPAGVAFELSDCLGYMYWDRAGLENHIRGLKTYEALVEHERAVWEEITAGNPDADIPFEEFVTPREAYDRARVEIEIEDRLPDLPAHFDIFFRPLLAQAVKRCSSRQEAGEVLRLFYTNFNECVST